MIEVSPVWDWFWSSMLRLQETVFRLHSLFKAGNQVLPLVSHACPRTSRNRSVENCGQSFAAFI
jgi:hypothetical protein